ncbi:MAG: hypothetical protein ACT4R6_07360 [Gemmatimonadaceae bacterium]
MMRARHVLLGAISLGAAIASPGAQAVRLDSALAAALAPILDAARTDGLPLEPLYTKAQEGVLKRASRERIVGAVAASANRMRAARAELAPNPTEHEISAGAEALEAGVPGSVLRAIRVHRPRGTAAMPLEVMTHLVWRGVRADYASDVITRVVAGGASSAQLIALDASVRADVESGVAPPVALSSRSRGLTLQLQSPTGRSSGDATLNAASGAAKARPRKP